MIPNHVLNGLTPTDRVAILSRGGELHFLVHPATDTPDSIRLYAEREGSQVVKSHLQDQEEIQNFVASRERDVGGEA